MLSDANILPSWPFWADWPIAATVALLLALAIVCGELTARWLKQPRLLGYVAAGALLALMMQVARVPGAFQHTQADVVINAAAGVILFDLGQRVSFGWLRRNPALLAGSIGEALLSFVLVWFVLRSFDVAPLTATVTAAIAIATSPAVLLSVTRELRAQGQVTERALLLTAMNCIYAVVLCTLLLAWAHVQARAGFDEFVLHPLYLVCGSLLLAAGAARVLLATVVFIGQERHAHWMFMLGLIVLVYTLAELLRLSELLTLLAFGAFARGMDRTRRWGLVDLGPLTSAALVLVFVLTAATVDLDVLSPAWAPALMLILFRLAAKFGGSVAVARWAGLSWQRGAWVGVMLAPMSVFSLLLARDIGALYPQLGQEVMNIVLPAAAVMVVTGTPLVTWALRRARETGEPR